MPMNLTELLRLPEGMKQYENILDGLKQRHRTTISVSDSGKAYLVAALYSRLGVPVLLITGRTDTTVPAMSRP